MDLGKPDVKIVPYKVGKVCKVCGNKDREGIAVVINMIVPLELTICVECLAKKLEKLVKD